MNVRSELSSVVPHSPALTAVIGALGLALGGSVAAVVGAIAFRLVAAALGVADSAAFTVGRVGVQIGFGAVALGYLATADEPSRYAKVRWPTLEDIGWILVLPVLLGVAGFALNAVLSVVGAATPSTSHGAQGAAEILANRPVLWAVAIPALYLFAAPAEELLYRGVVQGRLRPHLGTAGVVLVSGLAFGLMHGVMGLVSSTDRVVHWIASTGVGGAVWALAYERTENLAVTAVSHAMSWTISFSTLLPFH
ncbi:CPBP family intramembrane glutamic endopeptidase [Halosimplex marinum]|uniref:CPBP family intramembrane glutamic endopeptidase n=1 Tax=Halosimplex marinum TaxID=3396620 RepID=UPI003F57533D